KGFIINKFRGDVSLFDDGLQEIIEHTGWHGLGVLPWFGDAVKLPAEDAADLMGGQTGGRFKIAVPKLSRIANFDDLDPLRLEPGVTVEMIEPGRRLPTDANLVLIPGSKSTIGDLQFFRQQGWEADLQAHVYRGGHVLGICGGYQMLGTEIRDPEGIEGARGKIAALGLLDVVTEMKPEKRLAQVSGRHLDSDTAVVGYEIHIGNTDGPDCDRAWLDIEGRSEGAQSANGRVKGCYIHGLFTSDAFRTAYLQEIGAETSDVAFEDQIEEVLDALAMHIETHVDVMRIWEMADEVELT
ncbi:MAG: cobyric acid synthase, partial [Rhodobacteraceae bacterium]|nr:cobyric acid synthase [Paracoccaceae bacterium]